MMAKLSDLAPLAQKVNKQSDQINRTISSIHEKLAKLNLGIEVWLDDNLRNALECSAWSDEASMRVRTISYLGYDRFDGKWQLVVKEVNEEYTVDELGEEQVEVVNPEYTPLLQASRNLRLAALPKIPLLLDELKWKGKELLDTVKHAEKFAEEL